MLPADVVESARQRGGSDCVVRASAFEEFSKRLIDVIAGLVPAVKPQAAFFEELGPPGVQALQSVIRYARSAGLIVICDAKRGDIGSTAVAYARAYLAGEDPEAAPFAADAMTVNPYLGADTLEPFVDVAMQRRAGIYVLVRTSNPGSGTFQDPIADGQTLYRRVADCVERFAVQSAVDTAWGDVGAVVGATYPEELAELRACMPHAPMLVPGYGSQGAGAEDVASAFMADGIGALINSSRAINFAYRSTDLADEFGESGWEEACRVATTRMIEQLQSVCCITDDAEDAKS